jgi:hypothetical protein
MSFWDLDDGESAATGNKEFEQPTSNFDPIPDGSNVLALIDEVKWDFDRANNEYLSVRWAVQAPEQFAKRKIYQKLWVTDLDPQAKDETKAKKKRDNAKRMLATIDANCGGKLSKVARKPDNDDLTLALTDREMVIKCQVWEIKDAATGQTNSGNWISAVFPKDKGVSVPDAPKPKKESGVKIEDDSIPFD